MKRKTLRISAELLADFLKNPVPPGIAQKGMPLDAVIERAWFDSVINAVVLLVASSEFETDGGEFEPLFSQTF